jgi:hypothetical protein
MGKVAPLKDRNYQQKTLDNRHNLFSISFCVRQFCAAKIKNPLWGFGVSLLHELKQQEVFHYPEINLCVIGAADVHTYTKKYPDCATTGTWTRIQFPILNRHWRLVSSCHSSVAGRARLLVGLGLSNGRDGKFQFRNEDSHDQWESIERSRDRFGIRAK